MDEKRKSIQEFVDLITAMDRDDEQYKADKRNFVNELKNARKKINDYCDVNERVNYAIILGVGMVLGFALRTLL